MKNIENWDGLRVLTVHEPWASLIVEGWKGLENRSRYFGHRGPLLIHASRGMTREYYELARAWVETHVGLGRLDGEHRPLIFPLYGSCMANRGMILGGAEVTDCQRYSSSPWFDGPGWGLKLTGAWKATTPVPFKGQLGLGTYHAPKGVLNESRP